MDFTAPREVEARMDAIYQHARASLYAEIDDGTIKAASPEHIRVRTNAASRDDYLSHPPSGEMIRKEDAERIRSIYRSRRPRIQIVISDGLNANAINENLRAVLAPLKYLLSCSGHHVGDADIIIKNGRVRAGYHIGALLDVDVIVHLIGERPGTGLNTLSAYLTYCRDVKGRSRWSPALDHSNTTAVCGIHPRGKPPATATEEIARCIKRVFEQRRSGVELGL